MVKARLDVYYTFKVMSHEDVGVRDSMFCVHAIKWEEFADVPMETYKILPNNHSPMGGCSCPAWTANCKHRKCVVEAIASGRIRELYKWRWTEKKGWEPIDDIRSIEDMPEIG